MNAIVIAVGVFAIVGILGFAFGMGRIFQDHISSENRRKNR